MFFVIIEGYGANRDLHVLTNSFPTRRYSDLQPPKILIYFGQLLAGVREEIFDCELGMMLTHIDCEGRAIAAARQAKDVFHGIGRQEAALPFPFLLDGAGFCM